MLRPTSLNYFWLSADVRQLISLSCAAEPNAPAELAHFVETYPGLEALAAELKPVAARAARTALIWSILSLALASFAAWSYFAKLPTWQLVTALGTALAVLGVSVRSAARQGELDAAQMALLPLPPSGPMSQETVRELCRNVKPLPKMATLPYDKPLYHAHLAWARAVARQQRKNRC